MKTYTTPPAPVDIVRFVPELAPYVRTAVRLHPHPMELDLGRSQRAYVSVRRDLPAWAVKMSVSD